MSWSPDSRKIRLAKYMAYVYSIWHLNEIWSPEASVHSEWQFSFEIKNCYKLSPDISRSPRFYKFFRGMGAVTSSAIWQIPPWYGGRDFVHDWKVLRWYGSRDLVGDSAPKMPCPAGKSEGSRRGLVSLEGPHSPVVPGYPGAGDTIDRRISRTTYSWILVLVLFTLLEIGIVL